MWVVSLRIAEEWGLPPWEVDEAPALWIDRWLALKEAEANHQKATATLNSSPGHRIKNL